MKTQRLQAIRILNRPHAWQVCGCCDAIINVRAALCPHCHHYRHDRSREALHRALTRSLQHPTASFPASLAN